MKCPGQDSRFWEPGAIFEAQCPECGQEVEFFKDESSRKCRKCGHKFVNPKMDFGCASYCKFASQCLGDLPPELMARREDLLRDRVAIEMKKYFKQDFKRIGHATRVARYAEQIVKAERGDPAIVISAAYLHDIGIKEAERKHQSTAARHQEEEGPPIAREILDRLGARAELIEEVCDIIAHHHHPRDEETLNFKCLYDADLIVNLEENGKENPLEPRKVEGIIEKGFLTETGKRLAREALTPPGVNP
ncbi:MAG: HD domain-containing protein [Syntrophobacteraceae bacterium]|jgi:HD superfamily phosphodiesterase|nr:HD domain-containing protein [Syntrophobacteraceae bacterium]